MKNDCFIVKDLLTLYSEKMVSEETAEFITNHLNECEECSQEYKSIKGEKNFEFEKETAPIRDIKKTIVKKRIATAMLSVFLVLTIIFTGYSILSTREYFEYSDDLLTVHTIPVSGSDETQQGVESTIVVFDKKVTGCSYYFSYEPEMDNKSGLYDGYVCHIEAWTSLWDRLVLSINERLSGKDRGVQILQLSDRDSTSRFGYYSIYYSPNNGQDEICVTDKGEMNGHALPRLVLNYYIILAAVAFIVSIVLLLIFRKKEKARKILTYISFVPISYIISQLAVMGFNATTYSVMRDFKLILLLTVFILCILISVYRIIKVKREIKEINKLN